MMGSIITEMMVDRSVKYLLQDVMGMKRIVEKGKTKNESSKKIGKTGRVKKREISKKKIKGKKKKFGDNRK